MDVTAYAPDGTALTLTGTTELVSTASGAWETATLTLSGSTLSASDEIALDFKMFSRENNDVKLSTIELNYIR